LIETRYTAQALRLALRLLLAQGAAGCLAEELCTPADSTYSCCLKQHLSHPATCSATEAEAAALRPSRAPSATGVAVGTLTVAAALASDEGAVLSEKTLEAVGEALRECAAQVNTSVNQRLFGGDPTPAQCDEIVEWTAEGQEITQAMKLGTYKHAEVISCVRERLGRMIPERFLVEQRYRRDPLTLQLELITREQREAWLAARQSQELKGSVVPDVLVHSGNPLKARAIFDLKFPCLHETPPKWTVYKEGPHRLKSQGEVYQRLFEVRPRRVTPWQVYQ
jgi:hypothetical protein